MTVSWKGAVERRWVCGGSGDPNDDAHPFQGIDLTIAWSEKHLIVK
jgi:hypothetical protein